MNAGVGVSYSEHRVRHRIVHEIQTTYTQRQCLDTPCESMPSQRVVGCWDLVVQLKPMLYAVLFLVIVKGMTERRKRLCPLFFSALWTRDRNA